MKWSISAALIVTAFASSAASAHWQFTKWGMKADGVVAASAGTANLGTGTPEQKIKGLEIGAVGTHAIGSLSLPAVFYFDAQGLQQVELRGDSDALCGAVGSRLNGQYGTPFAADDGGFFMSKTWKDEDRGNRLEYFRTGDVCWLKYTPLAVAPTSDL